MSDQPSQGQRGAGRPSSAQLNKERHERIHLLKEKQDHDRLRKLEELKEQVTIILTRLVQVLFRVFGHQLLISYPNSIGFCSLPASRRAGLETEKAF